jgi:hypothetical protein
MALLPAPDDDLSRIFLLRLWRERDGAPWRISLRGAESDVALGFANLEDLMAHLTRLTATPPAVESERRD